MNDNFFQDTEYKLPTTSNYMNFKAPGEYTFRVLSSAIVGWQYFNRDNKPVRSKKVFEEVPDDIKPDGRINHFWAFVVWNYNDNKVQILELTQKTIMAPMKALIDNPKWGNPKNFDISVTRKGTGMNDTEYAVIPNPHSPLSDEIKSSYEAKRINLEALFENEDPFAPAKNSDGSLAPDKF